MRQVQPAVQAKPQSRNKLNLYLDIGLALLFAVEMEVHFTGLALHELLGLGFAVLLALHLVLHWSWIVSVTRTFFEKLIHESRFNYVLNLALLIDIVVVTISGIVISHTLGLEIGLAEDTMTTWEIIHMLSAQGSLLLTALHVAMHWKWILSHTQKYLFRLPSARQEPTVLLPPLNNTPHSDLEG